LHLVRSVFTQGKYGVYFEGGSGRLGLEYKETIKRLVAITEKREKTLGLEGTDRICRRISNDYGNGPTGMAAFQAQERP